MRARISRNSESRAARNWVFEASFLHEIEPQHWSNKGLHMGEQIRLTSQDGMQIGAYRAVPRTPARGAVVVLQEIFGVNHHIRAVADRFAGEGYVAIAPALFDRVSPAVELGYGPEDRTKGMQIVGKVDQEKALADVQAGIAAAADGGKVGVVGYCWGGTLSFLAAARLHGLSAAVGYYGGGIARSIDQTPKVPIILHFGERDNHIPMSDVADIRARYPGMRVYSYAADHGFNCDERESFDRASADLAHSRTQTFFAEHLASR
jgi:carboxymethylenebutenolidase